MDLGRACAAGLMDLEVFRTAVTPVIETVFCAGSAVCGYNADVVNDKHRPAQKLGEFAPNLQMEILTRLI